ncbi:hypothetical protein NDU88_012509 [Pleurodeles waltl]|uniref:Uncharacterized protein n=1 Tax=Pleurodeles waltl TaxID=8319 RepID=A0AAV7R254_PLEWA|nr:hypothetical protein NDU88_012509 [Pleurodeles waltl]
MKHRTALSQTSKWAMSAEPTDAGKGSPLGPRFQGRCILPGLLFNNRRALRLSQAQGDYPFLESGCNLWSGRRTRNISKGKGRSEPALLRLLGIQSSKGPSLCTFRLNLSPAPLR